MRVAILIAPRDFRDETVSNAKSMFEKWGVEPVITSYTSRECVGSHGATYRSEINAAKVGPEDFDIIFLVDGKGIESYKLYDLPQLLDTLKRFSQEKKTIACVGNAVKIAARANVISNKAVSVSEEEETNRLVRLYKGVASENEMEADSNLFSLKNPEKTGEFVGLILEKMGVK